MQISRFLTSDKGVLSGLLVFVLFLVSVAWTHSLAEARREAAAKTLHFAGVRNDYGQPGVPPHGAYREPSEKQWSVRSAYTPGQDSFVLDLRQGAIPVDDRLKVFANFIPGHRQDATGSHWLTRVANGRYRATGVRLDLGTWTIGLTGYLNSRIAFRLEQTLKVE